MRRVLLIVVLFFAFATSAVAKPVNPPIAPPVTTPTTSLTTPPSSQTDSGGGLLNSPDMTQALGGEDASCTHLAGASATVIQNCHASGLAESAYPPGNFAADTHVNTGITKAENDFASMLQHVFGGAFGVLAQTLTWILLGLGLAFGFDLFGSDHSGQVTHGLNQIDQLFTQPLLPVFLIVGGLIGVFYWIAQRAEGRAVTHWLVMILMVAFALIVIQNPVGVFGWLDQAANGISSGALAAFNGQTNSPANGFADASPGIYQTAMERPWCAVEFGSVEWCMSPPDAKMAAARQAVLQHLDQALGDQGTAQLAKQQAPLERTRLNDARTNGELFLSFPANSNARNGQNDDWTLYHALLNDHPEYASLRTTSGVWQRAFIIIFASLAGLAFLILITYIAYQLVVASFAFLLGLLLTPFVIFLPLFGESGQRKFLQWLGITMEALFKKVIFAVYLGIILLLTRLFLGLTQGVPLLSGWGIQWLGLFVLWVMAFAYRHRYLDVVSGGMYHSHGHPGGYARRLGTVAAASYLWKKAPQSVQAVHHHSHDSAETHQHVHVHGTYDAYGGMDDEGPVRVPNHSGGPNGRGTVEGQVRELEE